MVVICSRAGGLGNRLFVFAHFIANAIEFNYEIVNPSFFNYAKYFKTTSNDLPCRYPSRSSTIKNIRSAQPFFYYLVYTVFKILSKLGILGTFIRILDISLSDKESKSYDLAGKDFIRMQRSTQLILVRGWLFRDFINMIKYAQTIREFFIPLDPYVKNISYLIDRARNNCDVLIGVHIRQGDYSTFANGKYFYHATDYCRFMQQAIKLFPNKRVKFLICSNSPQDETIFRDLNYIMSSNQLIEDMYSLAKCDYIIGPPSTYTGWASFYGSVPIFTVTASNENISLDNVKVCQG